MAVTSFLNDPLPTPWDDFKDDFFFGKNEPENPLSENSNVPNEMLKKQNLSLQIMLVEIWK